MCHTLAFKVVAKQFLQLGAEGTKQDPGASEASTLADVGGGLGFLAVTSIMALDNVVALERVA